MPLFSIIVPVYNSEQFLLETIQSVLHQNFRNLEIILVNDCSTDRSGEICNTLSKEHNFIKTIHNQKNVGVSASRNTALKAASGEYILFLDSDDCLVDESLSGLANLIEEKPGLDLVIGKYTSQRYSLRGDEGSPQDFTFNNAAIDIHNPDGVIAHIKNFTRLPGVCWRFAINRNFIINNNLYFIPARVNEDQEYVIRLLCLTKTFVFYDKCLYWYRARAGSLTESITHSVNYDNSAGCLRVVGEICKLAGSPDFSNLKKEFLYARMRVALNVFYEYLPMYNRREISNFSKIIDANAPHFQILEKISGSMGVYSFIKTYGSYYGLLLFKTFITEKTISLVEKTEGKRLYIFCADLFGKTTAQILQNAGHTIQCFLDNNKGLEGKTILNLKVNLASILSNESQTTLADIFVIVCHQRKGIFEAIKNQLEQMGLQKNQITHQTFGDELYYDHIVTHDP